jgi:hypothetical protein
MKGLSKRVAFFSIFVNALPSLDEDGLGTARCFPGRGEGFTGGENLQIPPHAIDLRA